MIRAIYGGSFDPPHVGHVLALSYVLSVGLADAIVVVPVFDHALHKELTSFEQRVRMCELAFLGDRRVLVSGVEQTLPRPSYTLRTIEALRAQYPEDTFRLIVGADVLGETQKWHQFDRVVELAPLIVLGRRGVEHPDAPPALLPEVSSSSVRSLFAQSYESEGDAVSKRLSLLVPEQVRSFALEKNLYRKR